MSVDSVVTVWQDKGLVALTEDNWLQQGKKNIAYFLEKNLQVSGKDTGTSRDDDKIDRSYAQRTSPGKKMVFLSKPTGTNTLFPVVAVEEIDFDASPLGHDHEGTIMVHQDIQVMFVDKKPEYTDRLRQLGMKAIKNARQELHTYNMMFQPAAFIIDGSPSREDPEIVGIYFNTVTFRFFSLIA